MGRGDKSPPTPRRSALESVRKKIQTSQENCQQGIANAIDTWPRMDPRIGL